ncbi:BtpA/SgcQ family protein [bacterium]|nr:BtpA/SgcQ family protein [bacterium]
MPEWSTVTHPIIGMLHAPPLPGSPRYQESMEAILQHVLRDAETLAENGVDGLMLENFGDVPFTAGAVSAVTVASLTRLAAEVRQRFALPLGINVLRNDALAALGIAATVGARYIRVNVLSGVRVTDQGLITGPAYDLLRQREQLAANEVRILADVDVKHSAPITRRPLSEETEELVLRAGADGVIVSGAATGKPVNLTDLPEVVAAAQGRPVFVGSGVSVETLPRLLPFCHGVIVGSSLKPGGQIDAPVSAERVCQMVAAIRSWQPE